MLAVARALAARGHRVTFSSGTQHAEEAAREGLRFVEMPIIVGSTHERLRPYEDSEVMARAFMPILDVEQPDVVVADLLTLGPALAAEARRIPLATLLIHPLHSPSRDLPPFGWGRAPARGMLRWRDAWLRASNVKTLQRASDGLYWNPAASAWQSGTSSIAASLSGGLGSATRTWTTTDPLPSGTGAANGWLETTYTLHSQSVDNAGNQEAAR